MEIKRIDWYMQFASGRRRKAIDSGFAKEISVTDNGRHIYFNRISHKPIGAKIFCVVRPVDTPTAVDAYHPSPMVEFWVREPKWSAVVEPISRPGVVQGVEAQTLHLKCAVTGSQQIFLGRFVWFSDLNDLSLLTFQKKSRGIC